ncbi:MAG: hypothetical protein Q8R00_01625 [Candidatus Nanoarchaeia archaeon]|nr:hypothetical protein [Candidatus Nanoarchaeia archaeon]
MKISKAELILRIGIFGTFLGHGIFAIGVKEAWLKYLNFVGFTESAPLILQLIGYIDVIVALFALFLPLNMILIWATIWAFATALIRPLTGEPIWDFVERTSNWAAPLALYLLRNFKNKAILRK